MARKTPVDKLNSAISDILTKYAGEVRESVNEITKEVGKKGAQAVRQQAQQTFPVGNRKITGDYANGWKVQITESRTGTSAVIYNEHPGLPHLLEYGHVTRNGTGRTFPRTPAHEHIAPVAEEIAQTFEKEVLAKL